MSLLKIHRNLIVILCLCAGSALSAQELYFDTLCKEAVNNAQWGKHVQGMAACGDIAVQMYDHNPGMALFRLPEGKLIAEIPLEEVKTWHNNNAAFSDIYYKKGDVLPLLYASQENIAEHKTNVWRITRKGCKYKAEIVQTIIFPAPLEMGLYYPNIGLDFEHGYIYLTGYNRESWNKAENGNAVQILRFRLPSVEEGAVVELSTKDIQMRHCTPFKIATQGATVRGGRLYQVFGVPSLGPTLLVCVDLASGKTLINSPLNGITTEPEGVAFYGDKLLVAGADGVLYLQQLDGAEDAE